MKRTITLALLIWLSAQAAYCQEDAPAEAQDSVSITVQKNGLHERIFGIELGVGDAWLFSPSVINGAVLSWRVGGFVYVHLMGKLYLQPGLYYATSGGAQQADATFSSGAVSAPITTYTLHQIEVPVNIGFRYGHRKVNYKSFIGIGGYIARNMSGSLSYRGLSPEPLNIGASANSDIQPFDVGVGLNTSCEWRCGLFLRARFQYGLTNLEPSNSSMNSFGYGFQLGYLFGQKPPLVRKHIKWTTGDDNYIDRRMQ